MFDEMISKKLIEWIWVLASIGVVINGIVLMIAGRGGLSFLLALIFMAIGLLVVRVFCESMIVIFKMHENLAESAFALGEIQRYQPQIVSRLAVASAPSSSPEVVSVSASAAGRDTALASTVSTTSTPPTISTQATKGSWSGYSGSSET